MDKLLTILFIVLLFITPILVRQAPSVQSTTEEKVVPCTVDITVEGLDEPIPLEEYIVGVVAAEMPVQFHEEALQAQAIASRTYALRTTDGGKKTIAANVSAQVYATKTQRKEKWGKDFRKNEKKVRAAVQATEGQILTYNDEIISAMFFSTSNGKTESSQSYSGHDLPYLQSVESPGEEKVAPIVQRQFEFTLTQWNNALGVHWNENDFRALQLVRNSTGRVQKAITSTNQLNGREMRELLGLASTDFNIAFDVTNNIVHVTTTGYGHGVGMSQYGAEAFAQKGWTAEQILLHYYSGVEMSSTEQFLCPK